MSQDSDSTQTIAAYPLTLRMFGPLQVLVDGDLLPKMRSRKEEWLLALLALSAGRDVSRTWLAETLWPFPDYAEEHAGHYLRRSLMLLRRGLGGQADRLTAPTPRSLCLDLSGAFCDVAEFDSAIARGDSASLERAVQLYRGPLLDGCPEHWAISARISREDAYFRAVESLSTAALARNDAAQARGLLRLAAAVAPLREPIHRLLMEAYVAEHQAAEALKVYHDLRARRLRETNTEPDPETTTLFRNLRDSLARNGKSTTTAPGSWPPPMGGGIRIPSPLTSLVGREADVDEIVERYSSSRLITLSGPGGIGKTRLAIEVGRRLGEKSRDGVVFVDLSPLMDPTLVPSTILSIAAPSRIDSGESPVDALTGHLRDRELLLILDNCEQVLEACAELVQPLLRECSGLGVLATSRERLHIPGELVWRVKGLLPSEPYRPSPPPDKGEPQIWAPDAVRLFAERASTANPDFTLTPRNKEAVSEICARLDGIPLAIELAAVAVRAMPVALLAQRLDDYFHVQGDMPDAGPPRQRTLRAALDWSYGLLSPEEQTLLMSLSVFAGTCSLEAVEAVCVDECAPRSTEVLGILMRLVDKSLLIYDDKPDGGGRYRMLITVRQFASEKLRKSGNMDAVGHRVSDWLLKTAAEAKAGSKGADQALWMDCLDQEHDNMRWALQWLENEGNAPEKGLHLATDLSWFWGLRGHATEGRRHIVDLLAKGAESISQVGRLEAISAVAGLAISQTDFSAAPPLLIEALAGYRRLGDTSGAVSTLAALGGVASNQGDYTQARALFEEALSICEDRRETASLYGSLGYLAREQGDYAAARAYLEIAVNVSREVGDKLQAIGNLGSLAHVVLKEEGHRPALRVFEETLAGYRAIGNRLGEAWTLASMANVQLDLGEIDASVRLAEEALVINRAAGKTAGEAWNLRILAEARVRSSAFGEAEILLYRALALDGESGSGVGEAWDNYWLGQAAHGRASLERAGDFYALAFRQMTAMGIHDGIERVANAVAEMCRRFNIGASERLLAELAKEDGEPSALGAAVDDALASIAPAAVKA